MDMIRVLEGKRVKSIPTVSTINLVSSFGFEGTSGEVIDSYGGYHGVINGDVTRGVTGLVSTGNCFDFNGGEVRISHNPAFHLHQNGENKNLAFSFWVNFNEMNTYWLFNKRDIQEYQFTYNISTGNLALVIWNTDGSQLRKDCQISLLDNQTYHISGFTNISTDQITIKINNNEISGVTAGTAKTFQTGTGDFVLGRGAWDNVFPLDGRMDEARIWIGDIVPTDFSNEWNNRKGITL